LKILKEIFRLPLRAGATISEREDFKKGPEGAKKDSIRAMLSAGSKDATKAKGRTRSRQAARFISEGPGRANAGY